MDSDPTGMGYHFAWVTVDKNNIFVAPIKINSVQPWDVVTVADMQLIDRMNQLAVSVENAATVAEDLTVPASTVAVSIHNFAKETPVNDTIRWNTPKGWSVEPATLPVTIAPGGEQKFSFQVKGAGELYPVPSFAVKLPFKAGRDITVSKEMRVAREADCRLVSKAPTLDGKLDEAIWKDPVTHLFKPDGGPMAIESTYFYFAYDKSNLYLAARCKESSLDSIVAKTTKRDGAIFGEDCVGYFLQPDISKDTSYQVYFSALGTVFDQKISMGAEGYYGGDKSWNGNYTVRTFEDSGYWSVEARVPLAQFGIKPLKGMKMGINFLRKQQHRKGAADWQVPIDYNPRSYGVLVLQ